MKLIASLFVATLKGACYAVGAIVGITLINYLLMLME
jgi:hypothetical protein